MPALINHKSATTTKLLVLADSGGGKTGALASLAAAGYNLRILDFDNGLDVLFNLLTAPGSPYPKAAADRVQYVTITDKMKVAGGKTIPVKADAWQRGVGMLERWKDGDTDLGPVASWGPDDVLVIDSLSMMCNTALNFVLMMNTRLGQQPHQSDWFQAQNLVESMLQMLYSDAIQCNIVINAHIISIGPDNGPQRGYPVSLGKALSPKIGRYFNNAIMLRSMGQGAAMKRRFQTNTTGIVELKNSSPLAVKPEYDIQNGLAEYFAAVRKTTPKV